MLINGNQEALSFRLMGVITNCSCVCPQASKVVALVARRTHKHALVGTIPQYKGV